LRHFRLRSPALLLLAALAACGTPRAPEGGALTLVDDAGDTLHLRAPASRVVSLVPATTELLFAIGAGPQLVGRTRYDEFPPAAAQVADVGDGLDPNVEAVLAVRPDLVVLYRGAGTLVAATRLRALGVPALIVRTDRLEDVPRVARLLGLATGHAAAADSLGRAFDRALDSVSVPPSSAVSASGPSGSPPFRPTVLLLAWDDPPLTIGAGSFLDELVERAGGRNLFHDLAAPSGPVSLEAIAARDPDLILTLGTGTPRIAERPEWRVVRAVRDGRFVQVHGSEFSQPSPRSPEAIAELRAALRRRDGRR
jgi:ABC-type Fe3+-hydroxamate transport system substrate-binding protein